MFGRPTTRETELEAKLTSLEGLFESLKAKVAAAEASVEPRAARQANSILASIGVTEFASEQVGRGANQLSKDVLDTFNSLDGVEKTVYFRAHEKELMLLLGKGAPV